MTTSVLWEEVLKVQEGKSEVGIWFTLFEGRKVKWKCLDIEMKVYGFSRTLMKFMFWKFFERGVIVILWRGVIKSPFFPPLALECIAMLHPFLRACCMQCVVLKQRYEYEKVKVQFRRYSHMTCKWDLGFGKYFPHFLQSIFLNFRIFLTFLFSPSTNFFRNCFPNFLK